MVNIAKINYCKHHCFEQSGKDGALKKLMQLSLPDIVRQLLTACKNVYSSNTIL